MSLSATNGRAVEPIIYRESDGKPMADNTKQMRWIKILSNNLEGMFHERPDVFVAGNLMWYAVRDEPEEVAAPDVMIAFGRPKGDRGSYKQWEENDIPVTVAFEILSPSNDEEEMDDKLLFYENHGVEEYYVYDPEKNALKIYTRGRAALVRTRGIAGYVSRRMGIRFEMTTPEMTVYRSNGTRFFTVGELETRVESAEKEAADQQRRADEAERRASSLRDRHARLTELAPKILSGQATPEDFAEFARLAAPDPV